MEKELQVTNIQQIEAEITLLKQQTAQNIIEIGKRLIKAKELLPHGEWGKWLEEKVSFKERTAQNYMRVAREFSNTNSIADLEQTKIFALLDVPVEEREEFIADNYVKNMTTREFKQAIKEKKDAETKVRELKKQLDNKQSQINNFVKREELLIKKAELGDMYKKENEIVQKNLTDIINKVRGWCDEMEEYLPDNAETIDYEIIE